MKRARTGPRTRCARSSASGSPARCASGRRQREPRAAHRCGGSGRGRPGGAVRGGPAAVPHRGQHRRAQRGPAAEVPVPGHQAGRDRRRAADPVRGHLPGHRGAARAPLRVPGNPGPDPVHPGRRPRLPGAGPAAPRALVRAAPVAAAVQAAADGRRFRAVLAAGPLLPRRGLPQGPAAGVHPGGHRDELRHPGRRHRGGRGPGGPAVGRGGRLPAAPAGAAAQLRRGHGPVRLGQAGPAVRLSSWPT